MHKELPNTHFGKVLQDTDVHLISNVPSLIGFIARDIAEMKNNQVEPMAEETLPKKRLMIKRYSNMNDPNKNVQRKRKVKKYKGLLQEA